MDDNKDKKIGVKLVCVLLSFALWLYITSIENPNKTLTLSGVSVEILNADALKTLNLAILPEQDFHIDLKIEGPTNEIYSVSKEDFKLSADLGNYALKKGENNIPVQVINYPDGVNIKSESVLSIKVIIEESISKEVKLKSKVNKTFKTGYSEKTSTIEPEKISVSGPKSLVDMVDAAVIVGDAVDIDQSFQESYSIQAVSKDENVIQGVELSEEKATLKETVVKGKDVELKTRYVGALPEGLTLDREELSKSRIGISGDSKIVEQIEYLDLEPINLSQVSTSGEINVNIIVPAGVKLIGDDAYITVKLTLKDNRIVVKTLENVPITFTHPDDSKFNYVLPSTVKLTLSGTKSSLESITEKNILVESSLESFTTAGEYDAIWNASILNSENVKIDTNTGTVKVKVTLR